MTYFNASNRRRYATALGQGFDLYYYPVNRHLFLHCLTADDVAIFFRNLEQVCVNLMYYYAHLLVL